MEDAAQYIEFLFIWHNNQIVAVQALQLGYIIDGMVGVSLYNVEFESTVILTELICKRFYR